MAPDRRLDNVVTRQQTFGDELAVHGLRPSAATSLIDIDHTDEAGDRRSRGIDDGSR